MTELRKSTLDIERAWYDQLCQEILAFFWRASEHILFCCDWAREILNSENKGGLGTKEKYPTPSPPPTCPLSLVPTLEVLRLMATRIGKQFDISRAVRGCKILLVRRVLKAQIGRAHV